VYRESVKQKGIIAKVSTSNKINIIEIQVEPEEEELANPLCLDQTSSALIIDEQRNVMVDCTGKTESIQRETLEAIVAGFEFACKGGPLCGEPMRHVRVNLVDLQIIEDEKEISKEIMHAVGKAVFGSFLTAKPALLEPIYKTIITTPTELAGECSRILETKRGKVSSFEQKGLTTVITGHIPVSETFSLSKEIRSATSGRVFWQNILDVWKPVPDKLAKKVITQIRVSKGLSPEVPPPEKFTDGQQN